MPIYEFYCEDCDTIYNFFSRRIDTETQPHCPKCSREKLERMVSMFAVSKNRNESEDDRPKTIRRFTWHDNGAVYGAPHKQLDGATHLPNLHLCGTDQGFVGIVGSILSGISRANQHCLRD